MAIISKKCCTECVSVSAKVHLDLACGRIVNLGSLISPREHLVPVRAKCCVTLLFSMAADDEEGFQHRGERLAQCASGFVSRSDLGGFRRQQDSQLRIGGLLVPGGGSQAARELLISLTSFLGFLFVGQRLSQILRMLRDHQRHERSD